MIIYHKLKTIYIRVPGTGSSSFVATMSTGRFHVEYIEKDVTPYDHPVRKINNIQNSAHWTARQVRMLLDREIWNTYEKIGFIRNPVDWTNSIYRKTGIKNAIGEDNTGTYSEFLEKLGKTPYYWLTNEYGDVIVDKIYRTEDLDSEVYQHYGLPPPYKIETVSDKPKIVPTEADMEILRKKFKREFEHYQ